jgi:glycerate 2-kinase
VITNLFMNFIPRLSSHTLDAHPQHLAVKRIMSAAIEAADPVNAVRSVLKRKGAVLQIGDQTFHLDALENIYIIAFGKAAPAMASAASKILDKKLSGGIVISKYETEHDLDGLNFYLAGHPVPDENSQKAGKEILNFLSQPNKKDLVIFLISGGGSALITSPVDGVSLSDLQELTALLLGSGARIDEINTLRRALDQVKGGGLARAANPAKQVSLILSDVVDSPLEAIASGTTVPNPTNNIDALNVLEKYNLLDKTPFAILQALSEETDETNTTFGDALIVGSNRISAEAALAIAQQEGFKTQILTTSLQGEASEKGRELAEHLRSIEERPACIIVGGETTVMLGENPGLGGRNQEVALAAVDLLSNRENVLFITLATDGDDGPTDAAGAVVDGRTMKRGIQLGLDDQASLRAHAAYPYFDTLGDLLKPGPTGTNVNDLVFLFSS